MGYFKKKLSVVLLLSLLFIFLVSFLSINSFALTEVSDVELAIINDYEQNETTLLAWAIDYIDNNGGIDNSDNSNISNLNDFFNEVRAGRYVYFQRFGNTGRIICWCYDGHIINSWGSSTYTSWSGGITYNTIGTNLSGMSWYQLTYDNNGNPSFTHPYNSDPYGYFIPQPVYMKKDLLLVNTVAKYLPPSYGVGTSQDVTVVGWENLLTAIQWGNSTSEETKEELKKMNSFLNSNDVDNSSFDMPGANDNPTQDITDSGFNNIFDTIYNTINNWTSVGIVFPIPFTNGKNITVPPDLTENIVSNWGLLTDLFSLVWYFGVSLYIVKDLQKYIDGLKTGEILTKSDTNIKSEML